MSTPDDLLNLITGLAERFIADPPFTRASREVIREGYPVDPEQAPKKAGYRANTAGQDAVPPRGAAGQLAC